MLVTDRREIANLVRRFRETLQSRLHQRIPAIVGYKGGNMPLVFHWSDNVWMWMAYDSDEDVAIGRYWTAFGLEEPSPNENMSIMTEINFPIECIDRRIGAAFDRTESGNILVVHRGRIGGGREGIGTGLFWDNYRGRVQTIVDGDWDSEFAVIGELDSPDFVYQVRNFVAEVERIKNLS